MQRVKGSITGIFSDHKVLFRAGNSGVGRSGESIARARPSLLKTTTIVQEGLMNKSFSTVYLGKIGKNRQCGKNRHSTP